MEKINLHTHTVFCDGKNSPEEMILAAIQKNFTVLGFSGHTMYPFASDWHIAPRAHSDYVKEIKRLAQKYDGQIKIYCGFEADFLPPFCKPVFSDFSEFNPDYIIGSVHYLEKDERQFTVDDSTENVRRGIQEIYNNDGKAVVCDYFETQRKMLKTGNFQIWGHPDLVRKRNTILKFFNENETWYKNELLATVQVAAKTGVVAEINTGAIARGAMDDVYPSAYFLGLLHDYKIPVCINSDSHSTETLDCAFERAMNIAKKIGYTELVYPLKDREIITKI